MEYYLCRAMEAGRLTDQELSDLHNHEKKERMFESFDMNGFSDGGRIKIRKCLMPFEIQECLKLDTLKNYYGIPEDESSQAKHNSRLRSDLKRVAPDHDFNVTDVDAIHTFDKVIRELVGHGELNFFFSSGISLSRKKLKDFSGND